MPDVACSDVPRSSSGPGSRSKPRAVGQTPRSAFDSAEDVCCTSGVPSGQSLVAAASGNLSLSSSSVFSPSGTLSPNATLLSPRSPFCLTQSPGATNLSPKAANYSPNAPNQSPNAPYLSPNAPNLSPSAANLTANAASLSPNATTLSPRASTQFGVSTVSPNSAFRTMPGDYSTQPPASIAPAHQPVSGSSASCTHQVEQGSVVMVSTGYPSYSIPCSQCDSSCMKTPSMMMYRANPEGLESSIPSTRLAAKSSLRRCDSLNGDLGYGPPSRDRNRTVTASELYGNTCNGRDPYKNMVFEQTAKHPSTNYGTQEPSYPCSNFRVSPGKSSNAALSPNLEKKRGKPRLRISSDSAVGRDEWDFGQQPHYDNTKFSDECRQCYLGHKTPCNNKCMNNAELNRRHNEFVQKVNRLQELSKTLINDANSGITECVRKPIDPNCEPPIVYPSNDAHQSSTMPPPTVDLTISPNLKNQRNVSREFTAPQKVQEASPHHYNRFPVEELKFPELGDTPELKRSKRPGKDRVRFMETSNKEVNTGEQSPRPQNFGRVIQKSSPKPGLKFGYDLKEIHV